VVIGCAVGSGVGLAEGCGVGGEVGAAVTGCPVGSGVGLADGCEVGGEVGVVVIGCAVGSGVGLAEGCGVGGEVGAPSRGVSLRDTDFDTSKQDNNHTEYALIDEVPKLLLSLYRRIGTRSKGHCKYLSEAITRAIQ